MDISVAIMKFLGSKWFAFILGLGMIAAIPFTYQGMKASWNWWAICVFVCNLGGVFTAAYSFMNRLSEKKPISTQEW